MKKAAFPTGKQAGYTLTEILISMTIVTMVMAMVMSTFIFGLRLMYRDTQRLATNANLRYLVAQVSKETLDASEFYIFSSHRAFDGSLNLATDITDQTTSAYGVSIYHGDCLLLVTRVNLDSNSDVRQFRIYYRVAANTNAEGPIRYYESQDYGVDGTTTTLATLVNNVNLNSNPALAGSRVLAQRSRGRLKEGSATDCHPIFSSEYPTLTKTNENVSLNVEIINGTDANNLLSSSSFNYTISPRR